MKKKTTVVLMVLLLCVSMVLAGCRSREEAETDGLNDGLYNDNTIGEDIGDMENDLENAGEDIKDGVEDILDGNETNNHGGLNDNGNSAGSGTDAAN
ncbi:MAG: hypothetical protein IJN72_02820 [Firmicutes bacterium]|nr:hypothetical protein [Bacillota bacterium]MBR1990264.1 hypothetical protein [Bacillota bacterium]MBR3707127.1 hypothetical protein [Bacillota bacterium]MBR6585069.1 hypothetical protein [Bacillota bacterium]